MKVLGQSVDIPDNRISYNQYRLMFQAEADQAVHRFEQLYRQNQNLDDVIKLAPQQISDSVQPAVQLCVNTLVKHGILTIDAARFEEQYPDYQAPWTDAYFKLSDQYAEIVMDQESLDAYRVARRKGRALGRPAQHGVYGLYSGVRPRAGRGDRHRHAHRDGKNSHRAGGRAGRPDAPAEKAFAA